MQPVNLMAWRTKIISRLWWQALSLMAFLSLSLALALLLINQYRKTQIIHQQNYLELWQQVLEYVRNQQDNAVNHLRTPSESTFKNLNIQQKRAYCLQAYFWLKVLPTLPKEIWLVSAYQSTLDSQIEGQSQSLTELNEYLTTLRATAIVKTTQLVVLNRLPDRSFQFRLVVELNEPTPALGIELCNLNN